MQDTRQSPTTIQRKLWQRAKQQAVNFIAPGWQRLLGKLELANVHSDDHDGGQTWVFHTLDYRAQALLRAEHTITREITRITNRPARLQIEIVEPSQRERREEREEVDHATEEAVEEAAAEETAAERAARKEEEELESRFRRAAKANHKNKLVRFGVRNKHWRYFPTGTYEEIFWQAFLGTKRYSLWRTLRAYAESGKAWPSLRTLAEIVTGHRPKTTVVSGRLEALRDEGLVGWQDGADGAEYYLRAELPLLTPAQAETLSETMQREHRDWLREQKYKGQSLLSLWVKCKASTLVPPLMLNDEKVIAFRRAS